MSYADSLLYVYPLVKIINSSAKLIGLSLLLLLLQDQVLLFEHVFDHSERLEALIVVKLVN